MTHSVDNDDGDKQPVADGQPAVTSIGQAHFWIGVLHRRTVEDARMIATLISDVERLKRRAWWKSWGQR